MRFWPKAVVVLLFLGGVAQAATAPYPTEHFDPFVQKPATSPLGLFTLEGAAVGDGLEWGALRADYAHGLFAFTQNGNSLGNVIPDRLDLHLLTSFAYKHFASIGLDVPFTAYQADGFDVVRSKLAPAFAAQYFPNLPSGGLGDIRLVPKIALPFHRPFSLALIAEMRFRTARTDAFLGDQEGPFHGHAGPIFAPRIEGEGTVWRLRLVGELGYQVRGQEQYFNLVVGDQFTFGAGADMALPYVPIFNSWEVIAEYTGNTQVDKPFTFNDSQQYETAMELSGGVRARVKHGFVLFAGMGTGLSGGGWGRELFRAFAGVGWEPPNSDYSVPITRDEVDTDHDGIPDGSDRCPTVPGPADTDGCPDSDGDGIPDIDDKCPNDPGPVENGGCPVEEPVVKWTQQKLNLNAGINFETGKAEIKKDSFKVVDAVADFLKANPIIKKVRVEGHTDNRGSEQLNLDLSKKRAKAVLNRLIKDGIDASRLESEGYGFNRPIASNDTALGRAKNRRVEFTVLDPANDEDNKIGRPGEKPNPNAPPPKEQVIQGTPPGPPNKPAEPAKPAPAPPTTPTPAPTPAPKPK